jgi:hypothetical protein
VRARLTLLLSLVLSLLVSLLVVVPAAASPGDRWSGPYFGDGNLPPGCTTDMDVSDCYHMRTGLNALDSPKIDVLVVVPVSPFAERDARIQTQAVEMWAGGIEYLAREMGMDWLADTVEFRIAVNHLDLTTGQGTEDFSTYPLWDPEIVVISSNPVGGIGIGIDPLDFSDLILEIFGFEGTGVGEGPCHGMQNPFDLSQWQALTGFDDHHDQGTGTYYEEDCDGAGGNVCFAVNGAIDPTPGMDVDYDNPVVNLPFGLFDLVAHEVGHCLTLGHVGDALDHTSKTVPTWDIMAYTDDPVGQTKCVSTLDVEVFATRMSEYIDTTGDGAIGEDNVLLANDQEGDKASGIGNAFHVQHPSDHWYASSTGSPWDCPQPDLGIVPGERTEWNPEPARAERVLTVTSPEDGTTTDGAVTVAGTVERRYEQDSDWNPHTSGGEDVDGTPATESVLVHTDGVLVGSQDVWTRGSADSFAIEAALAAGTHTLRIDWEDRGHVIASETVTVTVGSDDGGGDDGDDGDDEHPGCTNRHPRLRPPPPALGCR